MCIRDSEQPARYSLCLQPARVARGVAVELVRDGVRRLDDHPAPLGVLQRLDVRPAEESARHLRPVGDGGGVADEYVEHPVGRARLGEDADARLERADVADQREYSACLLYTS